jgi:hypothetical protein
MVLCTTSGCPWCPARTPVEKVQTGRRRVALSRVMRASRLYLVAA